MTSTVKGISNLAFVVAMAFQGAEYFLFHDEVCFFKKRLFTHSTHKAFAAFVPSADSAPVLNRKRLPNWYFFPACLELQTKI